MNISQFQDEFAVNEKRKELFNFLKDEIEYIKLYCNDIKIVVFGSFIDKSEESPNDIDILLSAHINDPGVNVLLTHGNKLPLKNKQKIDITANYTFDQNTEPDNHSTLIKRFNDSENNKIHGVKILNWRPLEL